MTDDNRHHLLAFDLELYPAQPLSSVPFPTTFDECVSVVDVVFAKLKDQMAQYPEIPPHVVLFCPAGTLVMGLPPTDKEIWRHIQQSAVEATKAHAIAFINEGYNVETRKRVEVVSVVFEHREGAGVWYAPIIRDGGPLALGEIHKQVGLAKDGFQQSGLFSGWVRPRGDSN